MQDNARGYGLALASPLGLLYLLFLVAPISLFLSVSVFKYDPFELYKTTLTGENFIRLVADTYYNAIILGTVRVAGLTTLIAFLLSYPLAYFLVRRAGAWRGVLIFLVVAPLTTGTIVRTYAWIVLFGAEGTINSILIGLGLIQRPLVILGTETAVIIALVHILMPYMVFPLFSALAAQDPNVEHAASTLGAGRARIFFEVTLPLSRSGILMGSVLVFTLAAGSIVTAQLIGGKDIQMMGPLLYELVMHTLNWPLGSAVAALLVAMQFLIVLLYFRSGRRRNVGH